MAKLNIEIKDFRPLERGSLVGFATIRIAEMRMVIKDVAIHRREDGDHLTQWAQLPAKPQLNKDRQLVLKDDKVQYVPIMQFDTKEVADAFSAAVLRALDAFEQRAA